MGLGLGLGLRVGNGVVELGCTVGIRMRVRG